MIPRSIRDPQWNKTFMGPRPQYGFLALRSRLIILLFVVSVPVACLWTTQPVCLAQSALKPSQIDDAHVRTAIDAMVSELYERKHSQRFWDPEKTPPGESKRQRGGHTALVVLALLHAGQTYQDERLRDAIDYLARFDMEGTYAISTRANVWAKLPEKFAENLQKDTQWLLDAFSNNCGGWDYDSNPRSNRQDNSIRQFGALALWEAAQRGLKVDRRYWQRLEDAYIDMQLDDGGWNYNGEGPATGSMTAAGLATLFITQDLLHAGDNLKLGAPTSARHVKALDAGLRWLDRHFSATSNPGRSLYFYYYLWGIERAGLASGYKCFGDHDWFREGAAELLRRLCKWDDTRQACSIFSTTAGDGRAARVKNDDLAFALIFLSRGRVPVAINKLEVPSWPWNNRPRDAANLVRWIGEKSENDLSWQIVNVRSPPETWLDAPILYLASHEPLPWLKALNAEVNTFIREVREYQKTRAAGDAKDDAPLPVPPQIAELEKIRTYLNLGGLLLAINEGSGRNFAESIEKSGIVMFPHYAWRTLPDDHWIYTIHAPLKPRQPIRALSNGVRELIITVPSGDWSATFQKADVKQIYEYELASNIYYYASEMNRPRPRLAQHSAPSPASAADAPHAVFVVRAIHQGNWNPEPEALNVFAAWAAAQRQMTLRMTNQPLQTIHELKPKPALVIVSGIEAIEFSQLQIHSIRSYAESGGVILFETPGGRGAFTQSAEEMAVNNFGKPIQSVLRSRFIAADGTANTRNLTRVDYRPFAIQAFGTRETTPRLRGMTIKDGGQSQLLFSRDDISHALLDQPCWGVSGYSPQSARDLLANVIQVALEQSQPSQ
jgi:hypothetical protein